MSLAEAFQDLVEWGARHDASDIHLNVRLNEAESEVKYTISGRYLAPERFRRIPTSTLLDMLSVAWMDIRGGNGAVFDPFIRSEEHTSELQSLMRISYAVFCLKKKKTSPNLPYLLVTTKDKIS